MKIVLFVGERITRSRSTYLRRGSNVNLYIVRLVSSGGIGLQVDEQDEQQGKRLHSTIAATQHKYNVGIFSVELPCCQHHWQHHEHLVERHLQILVQWERSMEVLLADL